MNQAQSNILDMQTADTSAQPLPPARQSLVGKLVLLASLRAQLLPRSKRLGELRAKQQEILDMGAECSRAADEYQTLRASELRGEQVDTVHMQRLTSRRESLTKKLNAQADESAAQVKAISALEAEHRSISDAIAEHERQIPALVRAAGIEHTLIKVQQGRLKQLMEHIAAELADIFDGANVAELMRAKHRDLNLAPVLAITKSSDPDEIHVPRLLECPPFDLALASSGADVIELMRQRADALLAELLPQ
jgi:hypothetical protein